MLWNKKIVDKTKEEQIADVKRWYTDTPVEFILERILSGKDCDKIPNGIGEFGRVSSNPIPVNGSSGETMYLNRLRCKCDCGLFFHRLGSLKMNALGTTVDVFETTCVNGKHWDILYLDMYHPRRSQLVPKGYKPSRYNKVMCMVPIAFGTDKLIENFPSDLPKALSIVYADFPGESFARKAQSILDRHKYIRPPEHSLNLKDVRVDMITKIC